MAEIQREQLIPAKIEGIFTEVEHHAIAAKLAALSDEWDRIEEETGKRPKEAFDYSFGLLNGRELIFSALSKKAGEMRTKILDTYEVVKWQ